MKKQKKKKLSNQVSEQELLDTIDIISKKLAYKFRFGYHEVEDMKQQISIFAIEGIENYDNDRPLENFLWTHVRNRLFNYKRDNYQRPDKPCLTCPLYDKFCADPDKDCLKYKHKADCETYQNWHSRNNSKKNLMYLNSIDDIKEYLPNIHSSQLSEENRELILFLQEYLIGDYRKIFLKLKFGSKVYKNEMDKLANKIKEMLNND